VLASARRREASQRSNFKGSSGRERTVEETSLSRRFAPGLVLVGGETDQLTKQRRPSPASPVRAHHVTIEEEDLVEIERALCWRTVSFFSRGVFLRKGHLGNH
jgi:hypothetical protein